VSRPLDIFWRDLATRAARNDEQQRKRASERRGRRRHPERRGGGPRRADACWMARPRPRVTFLPERYRSDSELAARRRKRREREAAKAAT